MRPEKVREYHRNWMRKYRSQNKEKLSVYRKEWGKKNPNKIRAQCLKSKYGLTSEEVEAMKQKQENKCGICGHEFTKTANVDHCHTSGKVRGLLCRECNLTLGKLEKIGLSKITSYLYASQNHQT